MLTHSGTRPGLAMLLDFGPLRAAMNTENGRMGAEANRSLETMLLEKEEGTLTLDRPDRLNAFNVQMGEDWLGALDWIDAEDDVRAVIVTGAGRGFCAGADLGS